MDPTSTLPGADVLNGLAYIGLLAGVLYTGWQSVRAKRQAEKAAVSSEKAADHSYPISNGWGTQLRGDVAAIRGELETARRQAIVTDELMRAQVAEAATHAREANQHARTAAEQSSAVAAGLAAHLADHTTNDLTREAAAS